MIKREYRGVQIDLFSEDLGDMLSKIEFYRKRGFDTKDVPIINVRGLYKATIEKRVFLDECQ